MSRRSGSLKSKNSSIKLNKSTFQDEYLKKILEKEADDMIPYEIREEIINNALDEIYARYLEKRKIPYVLECSYDAFVKLLEIEYYFHHISEPFYVNHPLWSPDEPLAPSMPDTMCCGQVETEKKVLQQVEPEEELGEIEVFAEDDLFNIPQFVPPTPNPTLCDDESTHRGSTTIITSKTGVTENDFSDFDFDEDILKYLIGQQITESIEEDKISLPYIDSKIALKREAGIDGILNDILDQVLRETEGSEKSFVKFAKTLTPSGPCKLTKKPMKRKNYLKLPKIEVPEVKTFEKPDVITSFPPIRLFPDVNEKAKGEPEPEQETNRNQKLKQRKK